MNIAAVVLNRFLRTKLFGSSGNQVDVNAEHALLTHDIAAAAVLGGTGDAAAATDAADASLVALVKRDLQKTGDKSTADTLLWFLDQIKAATEATGTVTGTVTSAIQPSARTIGFDTDWIVAAAVAAYEWTTVKAWTVPGASTDVLLPLVFNFQGNNAGYFGRLVEKTLMGSWSVAGGFVNGAAAADDKEWWTTLGFEVVVSANTNATVTVDYLNGAGVAKSAVTTINSNVATTRRVKMVLATGDGGVSDVTGISVSPSLSTGSFQLFAYKDICGSSLGSGGNSAPVPIGNGSSLRGTRTLAFEMTSAAPSSTTIRMSALCQRASEV